MGTAILVAFVFGPLLITFLLKSNAALSFLALCAGFVVLGFASHDLNNLTGQLNFSINSGTLNLVLLILPLFLTLIVARKAFTDGLGQLCHLAVALCIGCLLALVAVPLLTESVRSNVFNQSLWSDLQKIQAEVVGAGVFLSLILVWSKALKKSPVKDKKHK